MNSWSISFSHPLKGKLRPPSSKSQTLRALLFASLSQEGGIIEHPLNSSDSMAMIDACSALGARFDQKEDCWLVSPLPKNSFSKTNSQLKVLSFNAKNSGIVWRFLAGVLSTRPALSLLWGDVSILNRRPMKPLIDALCQTGVEMWQTEETRGPCLLKGPWKKIPERILIDGFDSQPVSALLIAAALQENQNIKIEVVNPKEVEWAHLTVYWLRRLGAEIECDLLGHHYNVRAKTRWKRLDYGVPVDYSSSAFIIAATLITHGKVTLEGFFDDPQPDRAFIGFLKEAGACLEWDVSRGLIHVDGSSSFKGFDVDLSGPIDLLPVMMTLATYAQTPSLFRQIAGARLKESDRVSAMTSELRKMGAHIDLGDNEMRVFPSKLKHHEGLKSYQDHRIAMALAVAALGVEGESTINETQWVAKTYPEFVKDLQSLGANIKVAAS